MATKNLFPTSTCGDPSRARRKLLSRAVQFEADEPTEVGAGTGFAMNLERAGKPEFGFEIAAESLSPYDRRRMREEFRLI